MFPIHFELVCFEEKVELLRSLDHCRRRCGAKTNVAHYSNSIKDINT